MNFKKTLISVISGITLGSSVFGANIVSASVTDSNFTVPEAGSSSVSVGGGYRLAKSNYNPDLDYNVPAWIDYYTRKKQTNTSVYVKIESIFNNTDSGQGGNILLRVYGLKPGYKSSTTASNISTNINNRTCYGSTNNRNGTVTLPHTENAAYLITNMVYEDDGGGNSYALLGMQVENHTSVGVSGKWSPDSYGNYTEY